MRVFIATLLLAGAGAGAAAATLTPVATIDPASRFEFSLSTRWGQTLAGHFPEAHGEVVLLGDGRRQVRITLATSNVEILDHPRYTRFARGPRFFDAARFPQVQFLSDPYTAALLREGGVLPGRLRMHGIERREQFEVEPAQCGNPGRDCDIVAQGKVLRGNFDLGSWRFALRDEVRFSLRVRLRDTVATDAQ